MRCEDEPVVDYRAESATDRFFKFRRPRPLADFNYRMHDSFQACEVPRNISLSAKSRVLFSNKSAEQQLNHDLANIHRSAKKKISDERNHSEKQMLVTAHDSLELPEKKPLLFISSTRLQSRSLSAPKGKQSLSNQYSEDGMALSPRRSNFSNRNKASANFYESLNALKQSGVTYTKNTIHINKCLKDSLLAYEDSSIKVKDYWMPEENFLNQGEFHKGRKNLHAPLSKNDDMKKFCFDTGEFSGLRCAYSLEKNYDDKYFSKRHASGCVVMKRIPNRRMHNVRICRNGEPVEIQNVTKSSAKGNDGLASVVQEDKHKLPLSWQAQLKEPGLKKLVSKGAASERHQQLDGFSVDDIRKKGLTCSSNSSRGYIEEKGYSLKLMQPPRSPMKEAVLSRMKKFSRNLENQFLAVEGRRHSVGVSLSGIFDRLNSNYPKHVNLNGVQTVQGQLELNRSKSATVNPLQSRLTVSSTDFEVDDELCDTKSQGRPLQPDDGITNSGDDDGVESMPQSLSGHPEARTDNKEHKLEFANANDENVHSYSNHKDESQTSIDALDSENLLFSHENTRENSVCSGISSSSNNTKPKDSDCDTTAIGTSVVIPIASFNQ